MGEELNDVDLVALSRRLQIVAGSEGVRILQAGQLAGSLAGANTRPPFSST
jgi:hypothetical protein